MNKKFKHIGLISRAEKNTTDTLIAIKDFCFSHHISLSIEAKTAEKMQGTLLDTFTENNIPNEVDLIIVVGGDGSLLHAASCALSKQLPILGINRGKLGFLTDINPTELHKISDVLAGHYSIEERFLLKTPFGNALNDVVLLPSDAQMIEFDILINDQFVCQQRADGLIIATPTGSTAYALSGGGPILHPHLDAVVLVPMFPHTLSSRPIVINSDSKIELVISTHNRSGANISCDGQQRIPVAAGTRIVIEKFEKKLRLIHPKDYDYFATLREKLGWQSGKRTC